MGDRTKKRTLQVPATGLLTTRGQQHSGFGERIASQGAASPDEALLTARSSGTLDLLLTDVVMPGMTGVELAHRLRRQQSHLRILFMSGYTDAQLAARGQPEGDPNFIRKPFSTSALAAKIAAILAREG